MNEEIKQITYFLSPGKENTEKTLELTLDYAKKNNIKNIIIASATGASALKLKERAKELNIIDVTYSEAVSYDEELEDFKNNREKLEKAGIKIIKATHAFSGIEKSLASKYKSMMPVILISDVLRLFSEGVKVAVEITLMATDAGAIGKKEKILALAGSGEGVDTCLLLESATTSDFFKLGILEIICIPKYAGLLHG